MKKIAVITGIVILVLVVLMVALPIIFKKPLMEKTKATINQNVNAEVTFSDLKISLLRNFPNLSLELTDVFVKGKGEFQADTLFSAPSVRAATPLGALFNPEQMSIGEIILRQPMLKLVVGETGNVNWDLALEPDAGEDTLSAASGMDLQLDKIEIRDAGFVYEDRELNMLLLLREIDFDIAGSMYGTNAELLAEGRSDRFTFTYKGTDYISSLAIETKTRLNIDYDKMDITIQENELLLNRLPLEVTGTMQMPDDSMFFDLHMKTKASGFDNFLALVPPDYEEYIQDIETRGTAELSGSVNGFYINDDYPAFSFDLNVDEGNIHYADLPDEIKNISANVSIMKPQGVLDLTIVSIQDAHAEVKNSPVDFNLLLKTLVSDPFFDGTFTGKVDFNELKGALPMDSVDIAGVVDADLVVKGNYSAIEKEEYQNIQSDGTVQLTNLIYDSPELTRQVSVPRGALTFSPKAVSLSRMNVIIGQSDLSLAGDVTRYLDYLLSDGTLHGNLQLNAPLVNLNELLRLQVKDPVAEDEPESSAPDKEGNEEETLAFDVPANIDFTFRSAIETVIFDRLPISNVQGLITARGGKLILDGLSMQTLDGELKLTGSYENTPENQPRFDFGLDVTEIDIPQAYQTLTGFRKLVPVAAQSRGQLSSKLKISGQLSPQLNLVAPTIDGTGRLSAANLQITGSSLFQQLQGLLEAEMLKDVRIEDFTAQVEIVDGSIALNPFTTRVAGQETTISGTLNTENLLDMKLDFQIQREAFGPDIQKIMNVLPGEERIKMIPATVILKGPVGKPEVKVDLEAARKKITEEVKKSTKEDLQKSLDKISKGLKELLK